MMGLEADSQIGRKGKESETRNRWIPASLKLTVDGRAN